MARERPGLTALGRAARLRCPLCGTSLRAGVVEIHRVCPGCGLRTDRGEPDYFLGAVMLNFVATELAIAAAVALVVALSWPHPPWATLLGVGLVLAVLAPVAGYPYSRTLWLAVDLQVRPPVFAGDAEAPDA